MNPALPILMEHVVQLHKHGVKSLEDAKTIIQTAVEKRKAHQLYPELNTLAGLCQRVIVNHDSFRVMLNWYLRSLKIGPKSHASADFVVGTPPKGKQ